MHARREPICSAPASPAASRAARPTRRPSRARRPAAARRRAARRRRPCQDQRRGEPAATRRRRCVQCARPARALRASPASAAASLVLTPARASSSLVVWCAVLLTAALIVLRSFVFLHYEQADFDADQAIVGLMATHLAEGRAWPLFFYGQLYMMGVQAWMAAVVFLLSRRRRCSPSSCRCWSSTSSPGRCWSGCWCARPGCGRGRRWSAVAWFALLPPVTASRMVQAQGGTIEPLLYALLLWLPAAARRGLRPAVRVRLPAPRVHAVCGGRHRAARGVDGGVVLAPARRALAASCCSCSSGARQTVTLLRHTASMFGPDAAPPRLEDGVTNVDLVAQERVPGAGARARATCSG